MRLWHKNFIAVLPTKQLIGQVRELTAIMLDIQKNGKTNHILINRIMDYPLSHLYTYCILIEDEMLKRNFNLSLITQEKWSKTFGKFERNIIPIEKLFQNWHNDIYLTICYYNLLEKYLCGGITAQDFEKVKKIFYSINIK